MAGSASGIRAGKAFVELSLHNKVSSGLNAVGAKFKTFGASMTAMGAKVFALGSAGLAAFLPAIKMFADVGDAANKASQRTGLTTEAISELGYAAQQSGRSTETLEKSIAKMQKNIASLKPGKGIAGLTAGALKGKSPDEQFELISGSFSGAATAVWRYWAS